MRSIETLVRQYPDKTGAEIIKIQDQDKLRDEELFEKKHLEKMALIEDFNDKGGYFRSTFGSHQYRYDFFSNMTIDIKGNIHCTVESIVAFDNPLSIQRTVKEQQKFDTYAPQDKDRITQRDFEAFDKYLNKVFKEFWSR